MRPARARGPVAWNAGGRLWIFGGAIGSGSLNDLWRYDPGSAEWTWIGGANSTNTSGPLRGHRVWRPRATCLERVRVRPAGSILPVICGSSAVRDTTAAAPAAASMTSGSSTPPASSGSGVAGEATAYPSGAMGTDGRARRAQRVLPGWTDGSGNLWLFGGGGHAGVPPTIFGKYAAGSWTLQVGSQTPAMNGVYGTQGTAAATNVPGQPRSGECHRRQRRQLLAVRRSGIRCRGRQRIAQ